MFKTRSWCICPHLSNRPSRTFDFYLIYFTFEEISSDTKQDRTKWNQRCLLNSVKFKYFLLFKSSLHNHFGHRVMGSIVVSSQNSGIVMTLLPWKCVLLNHMCHLPLNKTLHQHSFSHCKTGTHPFMPPFVPVCTVECSVCTHGSQVQCWRRAAGIRSKLAAAACWWLGQD